MKATRMALAAISLLLPVAILARAQESNDPRDLLRTRVEAFYAFMQKKQFDSMWAFLGMAMREDHHNKPDEYVDVVRKKLGGVRIMVFPSDGKVQLQKTGSGEWERPLGVASTPITIQTSDGRELLRGVHETYWVWETVDGSPGRTAPTWYLAGEELKPTNRSGDLGSRPTSSAVLSGTARPTAGSR